MCLAYFSICLLSYSFGCVHRFSLLLHHSKLCHEILFVMLYCIKWICFQMQISLLVRADCVDFFFTTFYEFSAIFDPFILSSITMHLFFSFFSLFNGNYLLACRIGPHGAGLTNMMFSEDAIIMEFIMSPHGNRFSFILSDLFWI